MHITLHKHLFSTYFFLMIVGVVGWLYQSHRVFGFCYHATVRERYFFFSQFYILTILSGNYQKKVNSASNLKFAETG